jgi:ABC-type lipoprotein export system ATPase subunit
VLPLIDTAASASKEAPPEAQQLSADKQTVETAETVILSKEQAAAVERAEALLSFLKSLEQGVREEIKRRSKSVIDEISANVRTMWAILHPGEVITDIRLYLPKDADKAIDIGLKFHGVKQESPRLSLSEGYRNSLGLCIFLAMAKGEAGKDRPLFLDDVVVSLDRNHRGMVAELLEKEFNGRQVIILTHDREWYSELRHQLDGKNWAFKSLLPYETPDLGIRWSHKTTTFDDARAHLKERPDSAGNDARKIMDVELALIAEHLKIRLPYLRADKNDSRMAHEFLARLAADGKKCFQKKVGDEYEANTDALSAFEQADHLLVSWANRASHTFDLVRPEAVKLIDACERALAFFTCALCGKGVWFADAAGPEWVQCHCGQIRWRYGKG